MGAVTRQTAAALRHIVSSTCWMRRRRYERPVRPSPAPGVIGGPPRGGHRIPLEVVSPGPERPYRRVVLRPADFAVAAAFVAFALTEEFVVRMPGGWWPFALALFAGLVLL